MSRLRNLEFRFWPEAVGACVTGALLVLTLSSQEWIEEVFGVDPDAHSGSLEWAIVIACAVATCVLALMARRDWRRGALGSVSE
jgi:hypothetical protein